MARASFWRFSIPTTSLPWGSLDTVLSPHAPRPHAPPAGSGRARTLPRWRVPDTDRRIEKDGTGPDLEERPLYFIMSPNQAIPVEKSILFPPLVAVGP